MEHIEFQYKIAEENLKDYFETTRLAGFIKTYSMTFIALGIAGLIAELVLQKWIEIDALAILLTFFMVLVFIFHYFCFPVLMKN